MEVARRLYYERIVPAWLWLADAVGGFIEEAIFRVELAFGVLVGRVPRETEKRTWIRGRETPTLIDVYSWTDSRLLFSILVWPSLESSEEDADHDHHERVQQVKEAIANGAADKAWHTYFETDYGLTWDRQREMWVDSAGDQYDCSRFTSLEPCRGGGRG